MSEVVIEFGYGQWGICTKHSTEEKFFEYLESMEFVWHQREVEEWSQQTFEEQLLKVFNGQ